jgi:orotidine-5'-phosphate decarboxylase
VGKELFTRTGPALVTRFVEKGFSVFLDLKFHDIPNTVKAACRAAADLGVWMTNVHALGGREMLLAAREGIEQATHQPHLIAVTVLTSMNDAALQEIGIQDDAQSEVIRLAGMTKDAGLAGVVCSAREVTALRHLLGNDFLLVTPGIRPADTAAGDQKRVMTPRDAIDAGSSYLVIGRPITQAIDPLEVLNSINREITGQKLTIL